MCARDSTYKLRTKCDNEFVFVHEFENSCLDAYAMNNTHFIANEFCHETSFIVSNVWYNRKSSAIFDLISGALHSYFPPNRSAVYLLTEGRLFRTIGHVPIFKHLCMGATLPVISSQTSCKVSLTFLLVFSKTMIKIIRNYHLSKWFALKTFQGGRRNAPPISAMKIQTAISF